MRPQFCTVLHRYIQMGPIKLCSCLELYADPILIAWWPCRMRTTYRLALLVLEVVETMLFSWGPRRKHMSYSLPHSPSILHSKASCLSDPLIGHGRHFHALCNIHMLLANIFSILSWASGWRKFVCQSMFIASTSFDSSWSHFFSCKTKAWAPSVRSAFADGSKY